MQINLYLCTVLCTEIYVLQAKYMFLQAQLARKTQKDARWSHESMCYVMRNAVCHIMCNTMRNAMRHTCIILSMCHTMLEH